MARRLSLYPEHLPLTPDEQAARQAFIDAYTEDYGPFNDSDRVLLELASMELDTRRIITAARQHPIGTLTRLLEAMDATRAARMRGKKPCAGYLGHPFRKIGGSVPKTSRMATLHAGSMSYLPKKERI